jgi:hypothetical protein
VAAVAEYTGAAQVAEYTGAAQVAGERLGDPERVESFGRFGLHRHVVHHGVTGAVVGPVHQAADVLRRSLEDRLHPAIGQVADPSGQAVFLGQAPAGIAEEDTLDPAGDQDTVADHKQTVRRWGAGGQRVGAVSGWGRSGGCD